MSKKDLEFLIKRALVHLVPKEYELHPTTILNITRLLTDDIIIMDKIMEPKIDPLELSEEDREKQLYLDNLKEKMLEGLGVPREFIEPALTAGSEMIYHRMLYSYAHNKEEIEKLKNNIESTES
jgi:hypothetical protein